MPMPWRRATIVSEGDVYSWSCCCRFDVRATGIAIPGTDPDYGGFASPCVDSHPCVDAGFLSPDGRAKCIHCVSSSFGIIDSASSIECRHMQMQMQMCCYRLHFLLLPFLLPSPAHALSALPFP
jgi:hypothetical protein